MYLGVDRTAENREGTNKIAEEQSSQVYNMEIGDGDVADFECNVFQMTVSYCEERMWTKPKSSLNLMLRFDELFLQQKVAYLYRRAQNMQSHACRELQSTLPRSPACRCCTLGGKHDCWQLDMFHEGDDISLCILKKCNFICARNDNWQQCTVLCKVYLQYHLLYTTNSTILPT